MGNPLDGHNMLIFKISGKAGLAMDRRFNSYAEMDVCEPVTIDEDSLIQGAQHVSIGMEQPCKTGEQIYGCQVFIV